MNASPRRLTAAEIREPDGYIDIPAGMKVPVRVNDMLEMYSTGKEYRVEFIRFHMAGYRVREVTDALCPPAVQGERDR